MATLLSIPAAPNPCHDPAAHARDAVSFPPAHMHAAAAADGSAARIGKSRIPRPRLGHVDRLRGAVHSASNEGSGERCALSARIQQLEAQLQAQEARMQQAEAEASGRMERCALWEKALTGREQKLLLREDAVQERERALERLHQADELLQELKRPRAADEKEASVAAEGGMEKKSTGAAAVDAEGEDSQVLEMGAAEGERLIGVAQGEASRELEMGAAEVEASRGLEMDAAVGEVSRGLGMDAAEGEPLGVLEMGMPICERLDMNVLSSDAHKALAHVDAKAEDKPLDKKMHENVQPMGSREGARSDEDGQESESDDVDTNTSPSDVSDEGEGDDDDDTEDDDGSEDEDKESDDNGDDDDAEESSDSDEEDEVDEQTDMVGDLMDFKIQELESREAQPAAVITDPIQCDEASQPVDPLKLKESYSMYRVAALGGKLAQTHPRPAHLRRGPRRPLPAVITAVPPRS
ncbi:hypothetical protein AB1Y20_008295 [Prymnesium parvum]|uniref:Uncharacterized protein n=1 Tax=Prymnesium parvum TaxID=97485 RepID=A0AB34IW63_PRYPA